MNELQKKRKRAEAIVNKYALGCAGTAAATGPLPGTSIVLTGMEAAMVYHIARVYDFTPTLQEAGVTVGALVAATTPIKTLAVEASTTLPVIGWWLIKPGVAVAVCKALGKLAVEHYEKRFQEERATVGAV